MIAEAVRKAEGKLRPARVSAVHGHEPSICFNRRFHMTDGTVGWNPGKLNPKILKPAGPIDPDVAVVYFESDDKESVPLATYVNYSVHLDNVGGTKFSADLPATVSDLLGRFKGPDMVTLYTAGCCGDVNHIDVNWAAPQGGHANAARMGVILAGEILRAWPRLKADPPGGLRVRTARVRLPLPEITDEDIASARAVVARLEDKARPVPFLEQVQAFKVLDVEAREGEPNEVEVQVIALGDRYAWVSLPGEVFVELGLAIKQDSPFEHTIVAELANGIIGYIPSRRAYAQGNYEVVERPVRRGFGRDAGGRGGGDAQGAPSGGVQGRGEVKGRPLEEAGRRPRWPVNPAGRDRPLTLALHAATGPESGLGAGSSSPCDCPARRSARYLLLWAAILATLLAFNRVSPRAAGLLVPHLACVTFAAALDFAIWRLNA